MKVNLLLTRPGTAESSSLYCFTGAKGKVAWPMRDGHRLGQGGAYNAFLRMGWRPVVVSAEMALAPETGDLLLVCASAPLENSEYGLIERWLSGGGRVVASGVSESWAKFLPGVRLEIWRESMPYAAMAYVFGDQRPRIVSPSGWPFFRVESLPGEKGVRRIGCVASVHGERQTPSRALLTKHDACPAAIQLGNFVLLSGNPFGALQAWLQGQEDIEPWLAWRHRLFWLDEFVADLRELLINCGALDDGASGPGVQGLNATTVVLRHDLDHSCDVSYLELEHSAKYAGVHALLKDRNFRFWREALKRYPEHESAFHYDTAHYSRLENFIRTRWLDLPPKPYLPEKSKISGRGLLRQVRWARSAGIGIATLHRHLAHIYYPEYVDALDVVFRHEPDVLGASSFYRGQLLRWGVDRADGTRGSYADFPDPQFPYSFPFRLAHAGDGGRLLRGWETTSMMEVEPELLEQMLDHKLAGLPQRLFVLNYHPAHANRASFVEGGNIVWFRKVLELIRSRGVQVMTLRKVFETLDAQGAN